MPIKDSIYGTFNIDPLLKQLINTSTVQRLKNTK